MPDFPALAEAPRPVPPLPCELPGSWHLSPAMFPSTPAQAVAEAAPLPHPGKDPHGPFSSEPLERPPEKVKHKSVNPSLPVGQNLTYRTIINGQS